MRLFNKFVGIDAGQLQHLIVIQRQYELKSTL